jgi:hypothetical protein
VLGHVAVDEFGDGPVAVLRRSGFRAVLRASSSASSASERVAKPPFCRRRLCWSR